VTPTGPSAKSKSQDLWDRLNALSGGAEVDDFHLRSLGREIDALRKTDAFEAFQLTGALAAIHGDIQGMRQAHAAAIKLRPGDVYAYTNYGTSLAKTSYFRESADQFRTAFRIDKLDLDILKQYIEHTLSAGLLQESSVAVKEWVKRAPTSPLPLAGAIERLATVQRARGLDDAETSRVVDLLREVAHRNRVFDISVSIGSLADDDSQWLSVIGFASRDPATTRRLNDQLTDVIAGSDANLRTASSIVIQYSAADPDANRTARVA
jgi:hypothetical protein